MDDLGARLHAELLARGLTVATAESLTGGSVADLVSTTPGASATFRGGVVAYASDIKGHVLGVSSETVERHGAVSARCAAEMAVGVRSLMDADFAVSTTGVAGPDEQEGKPVGLVYVGIAGPSELETFELQLTGDRDAIRAAATTRAVAALLGVVARQSTERLD
jgi:nicotinamide-nucleotide amidase